MSVIAWTVGGGSVMFIIGLISAIASRQQHKTKKSMRRVTARLSELTREEQEQLYALLASIR